MSKDQKGFVHRGIFKLKWFLMIVAVLILVRLEKKGKITVTDIVILMDYRLKMPSMDWNIIQ